MIPKNIHNLFIPKNIHFFLKTPQIVTPNPNPPPPPPKKKKQKKNKQTKPTYENIRGRGPKGGTLIFSYIRRLGPFFGVQNFVFQYFWGFQKNEYFLGYEGFVDIILGSSQNWTIFRGNF